ncbi:MAG TPA: polymer-forming cytoskeletal protein [Ramlibacter sp.]|uniref:bactofilin family protein n=1 Tax=Ramlibacter sp. TaxID=1917967 RepID=UPI002CB291CD|nr:polymer-forming cytoskeletal protein [Ramlibacter sp.]HVZ44340.1 polymer-forming cytoskeletal protein [Ramlibacter sp.]
MALQSPFFNNNKRESEDKREPWRPGTSPNASAVAAGATSAAGSAPAATSTVAPQPATQPPKEGESKLTVGPNIKLKGVEITDCDTLVVEGSVEATMDSRVIQISERGAFKGSADIDIAEIRGLFDGNLTVRQKLVIYSTGKVTGRVRYGKVVIEEGGQLSGEIEYGTAQSRGANAAAARAGLQQVHSSVG